MNKSYRILLTALILAIAIATVIAAPSVTVTRPNDGETLSGVEAIEWTASVPNDSQDVNARISYSGVAGDETNEIADVNLLEYCDFGTGNISWDMNSDFNAGFYSKISAGGFAIDHVSFFTIGDQTLNAIVSESLHPSSRRNLGLTWNGASWDFNADLNTGILLRLPYTEDTTETHEAFEKNGSYYLLQSFCRTDAGACTTYGMNGYKWTGNTWEVNYDINRGFPEELYNVLFRSFSVYEADVGGYDLWALSRGSSWFYQEAGKNWIQSFYLLSDYNSTAGTFYGAEMFKINNQLYAAMMGYANSSFPNYPIKEFQTSTATWTRNLDANAGWVEQDQLLTEASYFEFQGNKWLYATQTSESSSQFAKYDYLAFYNTSETANCEYSWNTQLVNGECLYVDVNVTERDTPSTTIDSSDACFSVVNWTDADINCTCISNCSSCTLDVNAFIVTPTDEKKDVEIKIQNGGDTKVVGYKIRNSRLDDEQYKINIATASQYASGVWDFSDSLTYGSTAYNSVQKIWQPSLSKYQYFFQDTIIADDTIYYKFEYDTPIYYYSTVRDVDWDNELVPSISDINGFYADLFSVYQIGAAAQTDIDSVLAQKKLPSITSDLTPINYIFQLTAKADSAISGDFFMGVIPNLLEGYSSSETIDLSTAYTTLTNSSIANGFIRFSSSVSAVNNIYAYNYVVTERGFFSQPIQITEVDGSALPLYVEGGKSYKYVTEDEPFRVRSGYYDPDGEIDRYEISAYMSGVADANKIKKWEFDADQNGFVSIDETIDGLIDLTASAPNRDIKITIRLIDTNSHYYEIQSDTIRMIQYPYFPSDFRINTFLENKQVAKPPKGRIELRVSNPNALRGVRYYIYPLGGAPDRSDYNKTFFKDVDFTCNGFDCSFDYEIDDYLFTDGNTAFALTVSGLLTTENEDYNSPKTARTIYFIVYWKEFETLRIFETIERNADHTYRNDEEISLALQMRDTDWKNLKQDVDVRLTLWNCDAAAPGGNCFQSDLNWAPDKFLYDAVTGFNYYFWKQVFIDPDGSLLDDGNYYRVMGTVSDPKGGHQSAVYPLLAAKCQTYDTDCTDFICFISNALGYLEHALFGCTVQTEPIVTLVDNTAQEQRLVIDAGHATLAPTQECHFCFNTDQNNLYANQLEQDIVCGSAYTFNETPIDSFKFYLTNDYSDLSKEGNDKQFIEFSVPYSQVAFNDIAAMRQALAAEYGTTADTFGELLHQWAGSVLADFANPISDIPEGLTATGIIPNVGYDCNFDSYFDPTHINGLLLYRLKGIDVINKQDYIGTYPDLENVSASDLLEYMNYKGYSYNVGQTRLEVYAGARTKIINKDIPSPLVIDEEYTDTSLQKQNAAEETVEYETLPTILRFTSIADLVYNGERLIIRRYVPFTITAIISPQFGSFANFSQFIFAYWWVFGLILGVLVIVSLIYARFKKGNSGGINVYTSGG